MPDNPTKPYSLRIEWTPTKTSSAHGLILRILDGAQGAASGDVGYRYPEVVAYNTTGKGQVIEVLDTDDEARDRASAIEGDFQTMTIDEWCDRYGIPVSFVTE